MFRLCKKSMGKQQQSERDATNLRESETETQLRIYNCVSALGLCVCVCVEYRVGSQGTRGVKGGHKASVLPLPVGTRGS